jgi:DNA-binding transcriptional LysR family regulator
VGKKVLLTQAGEQLLHHSRKILNEMEAARVSLEHLGKWGQSRLRIGASTTACQHILPSVLGEFKAEFPQMSITIEPGDTPEAIQSLRRNAIDLALVLEPRREEQFHFQPLFSDEMLFIVSPAHRWAVQGHAVQEEIPRQQYILYNKASFTFQIVERFFREEEMVLNTVMELGSMEAIKELVKLGLGVSVLAPWIARKELDEKSLVALPLGRRKLKRVWGIVHWKERRLSLAEERFVAFCRAATERLTENAGSASLVKRTSGE